MADLFLRLRRSADGRLSVAAFTIGSEVLVEALVVETGAAEIVERFPFEGTLDRWAAEAMARGLVDSYAATNGEGLGPPPAQRASGGGA